MKEVPLEVPEGMPQLSTTVGGKYRLDRVLGAGGMGVVYAAFDLALRRQVALKLLRPVLTHEKRRRERFLLEARSLAKMGDEHVARVLDFGSLDDGTPFIVMEFLSGQDFAELIRNEAPMAIQRASQLVVEVCAGIAEAHARGIVHRDIKPGNLFLARGSDGRETVKVLDFGISKTFEPAEEPGALTQTSEVFGSPKYMSPEQHRSAAHVTQQSDIWAIGVVLYELLSSRTPFERPSRAEITAAILERPAPPLSRIRADIPPALAEIAARCLDRDPGRRPRSASELGNLLSTFATAAATDPRPNLARTAVAGPDSASITERFNASTTLVGQAQPVSRRRWLLVGVVAVTGLLAAILVFGRGAVGAGGGGVTPTVASVKELAPTTAESTRVPAPSRASSSESVTLDPVGVPSTAAETRAPATPVASAAVTRARVRSIATSGATAPSASSPLATQPSATPCPDPQCSRK